jgi:hypothetical protein
MSGSAPYAQQARLNTCSEGQMDAEGSNLEIGNTPIAPTKVMPYV